MRRFLAMIFFAAALTGCDAAGPLETDQASKIQASAVPGTGDPAIDAILATFNNQVVTCATGGEIDSRTASTLALMTAILRFTPTPEQKLDALVTAMINQIRRSQERGDISFGCAATLTATLQSIGS